MPLARSGSPPENSPPPEQGSERLPAAGVPRSAIVTSRSGTAELARGPLGKMIRHQLKTATSARQDGSRAYARSHASP